MMALEPMDTRPGMSVRREIDERLEEARAKAFDEAITFLEARGHNQAARDLDAAAFPKEER